MKKLGTTRGRFNKNGNPYNQTHPAREFNIDKAEHIDKDKMDLNRYWYNDALGIDIDGKTRQQFLEEYYLKTYGKQIIKQNEKALAQRHAERCLTVEKMMTSKRYCMEGMLLYLGNKDDYADRETHLKVVDDYIKWHNEQFPLAPIVCAETHCDEQGAIHTSLWNVWKSHDKDGDIVFNQTKALEEMGFKNHNKRKDNSKKTFTKMVREKIAEIAQSYGIKLDLIPNKEKGGQDLEDYKRDKAKEEFERYVNITPTQEDIERIKKDLKYKKVGGNYIVSKDDFDKIIVGVAIREKIEPLMRPLSKVEKDAIYNKISKDYDEIFETYNDKHLTLEKELTRKVEFTRKWLADKGYKEEFEKAYKEHMKNESEKVGFDFSIMQNRDVEIEIEHEQEYYHGR